MTITFAATEELPSQGRARKPFSEDLLALVQAALQEKNNTVRTKEPISEAEADALHTEYVRWRRHEGAQYETRFVRRAASKGKEHVYFKAVPVSVK